VRSVIVVARTLCLLVCTYIAILMDIRYWRGLAGVSHELATPSSHSHAQLLAKSAAAAKAAGMAEAHMGTGAAAGAGVGTEVDHVGVPLLAAGSTDGTLSDARMAAASGLHNPVGSGRNLLTRSARLSATRTASRAVSRPRVIGSERVREPIRELLLPSALELLEAERTCGCCQSRVHSMQNRVLTLTGDGHEDRHRGSLAATEVPDGMESDSWIHSRDVDSEIHESQLIASNRMINDGTSGSVYAGKWNNRMVAIKIFKFSVTNPEGECGCRCRLDGPHALACTRPSLVSARAGKIDFNTERQELLRGRIAGRPEHPSIVRYYGYCLCLDKMSLV